ncbi:MAG: threonine ammonia-lyase [Bacteroidia bacterium]|nr:MAG: threonine ammonia-lyase [Bacteroidia bacterium]
MSEQIFSEIVKAQNRLKGITKYTPLMRSKSFSQMVGANVFLKLENLQNTGSFKIRGAYNKIMCLSAEERAAGVVCASAGNHAQGVAYGASQQGVKATVFMPVFTPALKVIATKGYGADVQLVGESYDDAYAAALDFAEQTKATYLHAFNDPQIIAGQGTIGLEILDQLPEVNDIIVPIGGGGLIAGVAAAIKSINPKIRIIGVEAEGTQSMQKSLEQGELVNWCTQRTIADGISVKIPGDLTFELTRQFVDEVVVVSDEEISLALYRLLQRAKVLAEPAGVTPIAAMLAGKVEVAGRNVAGVISGGNINMGILEQVLEKGMMQEKLRVRLQILIPDVAGELKRIITLLEQAKVNIHDILHERTLHSVPVGQALIIVTFDTRDYNQLDTICRELEKQGLTFSVTE